MTARTCPVHGEYSETGVCRWCEPKTLLDVALSAPKVRPLPVAEPLSSPPTYMGVPIVVDPYASGDAPPVLVSWTFEQETPEAYVFRVEWTKAAAEAIAAGVSKACEARLAQEHAALRWERVAWRWNYKHRRPGGLDCGGREWVWMHWLEQMGRRYAYLTWTPRQPP